MNLATAYRLGQEKAAADLGLWLADGLDNPTAPPAGRYTKTAIDRMVNKLEEAKAKKEKGRPRPELHPRRATKRTRFQTMVAKLKKKKKAR